MTTTWRPLSELVRPCELFWRVSNGLEEAIIRVEVDLQGGPVSGSRIKEMLESWWWQVWAPLIQADSQCREFGLTPRYVGEPARLFLSLDLNGLAQGTALTRDDAILCVLYGGIKAGEANRRIYIPFAPISYVQDHVVKMAAFSRITTRMRGMWLGCDGARGGVGPTLIILVPPRSPNGKDPGEAGKWTPVEQIICCSFTDRAPSVL